MKYTIYLPAGEIIGGGEAPSSDMEPSVPGAFILAGVLGNQATQKVVNGKLRNYTRAGIDRRAARPQFKCHWDVPSESWVDDRTFDEAKSDKTRELIAAADNNMQAGVTVRGMRLVTSPLALALLALSASRPAFRSVLTDKGLAEIQEAAREEALTAVANQIIGTTVRLESKLLVLEGAKSKEEINRVVW